MTRSAAKAGSPAKAEAARSSAKEWSQQAREIASYGCVSCEHPPISDSLNNVTAAVGPFSAFETTQVQVLSRDSRQTLSLNLILADVGRDPHHQCRSVPRVLLLHANEIKTASNWRQSSQ